MKSVDEDPEGRNGRGREAKNKRGIDIGALRLEQSFAGMTGIKQLMQVPICRPHRHWWLRVHPEHVLPTALLELRDEREAYLLAPELWPDHEADLTRRALYLATNRQGLVFLWSIGLPGPDGRWNPWHAVATEAAHRARDKWVRVVANQAIGTYDVYDAPGDLPPPEWPDVAFDDVVQRALHGRYIDAADHPVLRRLRGEM